jgi:hypothetical protein
LGQKINKASVNCGASPIDSSAADAAGCACPLRGKILLQVIPLRRLFRQMQSGGYKAKAGQAMLVCWIEFFASGAVRVGRWQCDTMPTLNRSNPLMP